MSDQTHIYDDGFFEYIETGARHSAQAVIAALGPLMPSITSVVDIGCGQGVWAKTFADQPTVEHVLGVDGDYVSRERLHIPVHDFRAHDLTQELDLGHRFDLAVSLEVAEHLPDSAAEGFVDTLTKHSDLILFSAAIPGQGGEHHVNEQPLNYWRQLFATHGYKAFDPVRPIIAKNNNVEPWYRYNTLLYVAEHKVEQLPAEIVKTALADGQAIPTIAPMSWRLRCALLRPLPRQVIEVLAQVKHALMSKRYQRARNA